MIADSTHAMLPSEMIKNSDALRGASQNEWKEAPSQEHQAIIGIPIPVTQSDQGPLLVADAVGAWAVERMRGRIFLIPLWPFPTHRHVYHSLWQLLQSMDGLFLPAGIQQTDWYSLWNHCQQEPGPEGWPLAWEMALAQLATYIGMPVLAIGDGAEKWNSALGGKRGETLREYAQTPPNAPDTWERHTLRVRAHSALATDLQPAIALQGDEQKPWELLFMPQQGVEQLAPGLRSCAQSDDGTVAAFERRDGAFGLGIVGRLDWGLDQIYGTALFDAFLHACQSFDRTRQQQQGWEVARDTICTTVMDLVTQGRPLILVPHQSAQQGKHLRSRPLSAPLPALHESGGRERVRQRLHHPTKEELNTIRRQKLKGTPR